MYSAELLIIPYTNCFSWAIRQKVGKKSGELLNNPTALITYCGYSLHGLTVCEGRPPLGVGREYRRADVGDPLGDKNIYK